MRSKIEGAVAGLLLDVNNDRVIALAKHALGPVCIKRIVNSIRLAPTNQVVTGVHPTVLLLAHQPR